MAKKIHDSIAPEKVSKKRTALGLSESRTWADFNEAFMLMPGRDQWRERLMYQLLSWSDQEEATDLVTFFRTYRIPRSSYYEWCEAYPDLKRVHENVMLFIGCRKREGALRRVYDKDVAFRDMHVLDPEWNEINKYHAELKAQYQDAHSQGNVIVQMMPAPDSKRVPARKIKEIESEL